MTQPRILIVEDEERVAAFYREALASAGYASRTAQTGAAALAALDDFSPHLVLLDIGLKGRTDGFAVLAALRARADAGGFQVVIISGRGMTTDIVRGLDLQADDYLVKPVSQAELLARVRARLRRYAVPAKAEAYAVGGVTLDLNRRLVLRRDSCKSLTTLEWRIVERLVEMPGRPVSFSELLRAGWGVETRRVGREEQRLVEGVIYRLRAKVEPEPRRPTVIQNIWGQGFKIAAPSEVHTRPGLPQPEAPGRPTDDRS
jgi:two-component system response regulator MtrA